MSRAALVLLCCAACAGPRQEEVAPALPARVVDPGECAKDGGAACYAKRHAHTKRNDQRQEFDGPPEIMENRSARPPALTYLWNNP